MKEKKYELIESDKEGLFRVKALRDFNIIKKGDIGGYVENEYRLSHDGNCWIYSNAVVYGNAKVYDDAQVFGNAIICDNAMVYGNAVVCDNVKVCGNAEVHDNAWVRENVMVCGSAKVDGHAYICSDAVIEKIGDYVVFQNTWSSGRYFTWTRSNNMWCVGCFYGTGEELIKKAYKDSDLNGKMYKKYVKFVESQILNKSILRILKDKILKIF